MPSLTLATYQEAELKAAREEAGRGFVVHLLVTAVVVAILIGVNVFVASEFPWAIFPVLGMGIGLYAHWYFGVARVETTVREHQRSVERRIAQPA